MALQRDKARLEGERGQFIAEIARARGKISETELQIIQLDQDFRTEVLKDLRDSQGKIAELRERVIAAEDQLKRVDIRAPQSGIVHQLTVHTVGGVIANGETIMLIVPRADTLVVEAKVAPQDIDQIALGAPATVRIMAGNQRTMPDITATLTRVSADLTREPPPSGQSGPAYYLVRVSLRRGAGCASSAICSWCRACRPRHSSRPTHGRRCNICSSRCTIRSRGRSASDSAFDECVLGRRGGQCMLFSVGRAHADPGVAHLMVVHLGIVDRHAEPQHLRRQPSRRRQQRIGAPRTRSRWAVTSATRALTSSCCALSTSRVVRWPTRASSRTPLTAISEALTWVAVAWIWALAASSWPQDCTTSAATGRARYRGPSAAGPASPWPGGWSRIRRRPDRAARVSCAGHRGGEALQRPSARCRAVILLDVADQRSASDKARPPRS